VCVEQVPKAKALTKWEQFAKLKGITKQKKSRMVFDEETGAYAPRFGYKRANDASKPWVLEHKDTEGNPLHSISTPLHQQQ
jgi:regulator of ribosome biosynthesis